MAATDASPLKPASSAAVARASGLPRRQALAALAIGTALLLAAHYEAAITRFPFDAALYWDMATRPTPEHSIRGYLLPALLRGFLSLGAAFGIGAIDAFRLFSSIVYAGFFTLLLPATCARFAPAELTLARRLAPLLLVLAVYPGLMLYPLSDLPALAFMWLSVWCLLGCRDGDGGPRRERGLALLAGLAAGAAYNTRTVYLIPVLLAALAALAQLRGRRHHVLIAALGFALASVPQVFINSQVHGTVSAGPAVAYGKALRVEGRSLIVDQLNWGIPVQKYETSIAHDAAFPAVYYVDPAGVSLLARICQKGPIDSLGGYLRAVSRYPMDFLGLYARHFVNGIDVRDGRVYVAQSSATKTLASFGCITLFMVLVFTMRSRAVADARAHRPARRGDGLWPAALVLPALLAIPGAMETRFMLPLMAYLFGAASLAWSANAITSELRRHLFLYLSVALAGYALFFAVSMSTMANATHLAPQAFCPPKPTST